MSTCKKKVEFYAQFEGDGVSDQVVLKFLTDPIFLLPPSGYSFTFNIASSLPVDVDNISVGGGTVSSTSYNALTHELTVNFSSAPTNGANGTINGNALYA